MFEQANIQTDRMEVHAEMNSKNGIYRTWTGGYNEAIDKAIEVNNAVNKEIDMMSSNLDACCNHWIDQYYKLLKAKLEALKK